MIYVVQMDLRAEPDGFADLLGLSGRMPSSSGSLHVELRGDFLELAQLAEMLERTAKGKGPTTYTQVGPF